MDTSEAPFRKCAAVLVSLPACLTQDQRLEEPVEPKASSLQQGFRLSSASVSTYLFLCCQTGMLALSEPEAILPVARWRTVSGDLKDISEEIDQEARSLRCPSVFPISSFAACTLVRSSPFTLREPSAFGKRTSKNVHDAALAACGVQLVPESASPRIADRTSKRCWRKPKRRAERRTG